MGENSRNADWSALIEEMERRRAFSRGMGGPEKLAKRRADGHMDARQRINELVDAGSFRELGILVGGEPIMGLPASPADALVAGMAKIEGRPILVGSEDFTVGGGSIGIGNKSKRLRLVSLAEQERVPLVMLLEGAGERTTNVLHRQSIAPSDLVEMAYLSGKVPTVAAIMGPSAGHGVLIGMLMDFIIIVQGAAMFSAGPPLVAAATGELVTKEELGGAEIHTRESGVAHNAASSEKEALKLIRRYLSYFPTNAWQNPPSILPANDGERILDDILDLIPPNPRQGYDAKKLVDMLADTGSVLEVQPLFGETIITALARLGGRPVAVVANQPLVRAGAIDCDGANKAAHFLEVADAFHLPVVFLADNPGIMAGTGAERAGTLRCAARMYLAQAQVRSPKLHVTIRKAYGFGSSLMAMNPCESQTVTMAFPGVSLNAMPARGGVIASKIDANIQASLETAESSGPWAIADTMGFDEIIDPRELRNALLASLELAANRDTGGIVPRPNGIRP
ncbi:acyl-CoA carboxylase subunit beta [Chloroflexota bacterium]